MAKTTHPHTSQAHAPLKTHLLASIPQFRPYLDRLQALGINTLEQVVGTAQGARPELESYLQIQIDPLLQKLPVAASAIPRLALTTIQQASYSLGVALDHVPRSAVAPPNIAAAAAAPPANVNLIPQMPPIRNQGHRGTCVAFATIGAYEHFLGRAGAMQD